MRAAMRRSTVHRLHDNYLPLKDIIELIEASATIEAQERS